MIDKRLRLLAAASVLTLGATTVASAAPTHGALKDCGTLEVSFGGFGNLPKGVPTGSTPQEHAFRVSGNLGCTTVRSVMQTFENNATSTLTINKPPAPGWSKCTFSKKAQGYGLQDGQERDRGPACLEEERQDGWPRPPQAVGQSRTSQPGSRQLHQSVGRGALTDMSPRLRKHEALVVIAYFCVRDHDGAAG